MRNQDVPGVVGQLGTVLGDARLNIAEIHLARQSGDGGQALAVVRLAGSRDMEVRERVRALPAVLEADRVELGEA